MTKLEDNDEIRSFDGSFNCTENFGGLVIFKGNQLNDSSFRDFLQLLNIGTGTGI